MSRYYGGWAPYVPVAERRRKAERQMEKLRKSGHPVSPVTITGRAIASTFWGKAWCDNIEGYHDYENRLPRGRTYVRNGSVVDLQIAPGRVTATVSGSALYKVTVNVKETAQAAWRSICTDCAGGIDSMVELLQGRFSKGVMERLCRQQGGLFPRPAEIQFSCSCPDYASMCKHVAAVLYGIGARLDQQPELLFRLRAVNEADLLSRIDVAAMLPKQKPRSGRILEADEVSALFGLDMEAPEAPAPEAAPRRKEAKPKGAAAANGVRPPADKKQSPMDIPAARKPAPKRTTAKRATPKPARSAAAGEPAAPAKTAATKSSRSMKAASGQEAREATSVRSATKGERAGTTRTKRTGASSRQAKPAPGVAAEAASVPARNKAGTAAAGKTCSKGREPKPQPVKWWRPGWQPGSVVKE
ncbi:MAG: SWIM zinc finger family protein [Rhodopila sp.]